MKLKLALVIVLAFCCCSSFGQSYYRVDFNHPYSNVKLDKAPLLYSMGMIKGGVYKISVEQQGIDAVVLVTDPASGKTLVEKNSVTNQDGLEEFEFTPLETKAYFLTIKRIEKDGNPESGNVTITVGAN